MASKAFVVPSFNVYERVLRHDQAGFSIEFIWCLKLVPLINFRICGPIIIFSLILASLI